MNRLLDDLNPEQRAAVITTDGPLLIIAGAGSGKTRVLTRRLAYLLTERKATPYQLLAVTFTNKAAGEMRERVAALMGGEISGLQVSTFHAFCARFLRREAVQIGYDNQFTVFDSADSETVIKNSIKELGLAGTQFAPRAQMRKISDLKNKLISATTYMSQAGGYFENATAKIYALYEKRLRECDAMDFDDLLVNSVLLLRDYPDVARNWRERFRYLLVDEYQDTNHVQYLLLKYLLDSHNNICVVGDEDQSIYGWRGADIRNILDFERDYPGAKTIKLEQNYRSTDTILAAASGVIANNESRKGKTLWTDIKGGEPLSLLITDSAEDEASHVVDIVVRRGENARLSDMAILYRTNAQSRAFEEQLRRRNIPYQIVGGLAFYQRKEIKDLLAYLKLIVNPKDDISFDRVVNFPKRGIGDRTIEELTAISRASGNSLLETAAVANQHAPLGTKAKTLMAFAALIEKHRATAEDKPVAVLVQDIVEELGLVQELLSEDKVIGQTKIENIETFIEGISEYSTHNPSSTLAQYLADISLFTDLDLYKEIDNKITLMTLHSAKGLEYDTVFLVGLEEGIFPFERSIAEPKQMEEERRLFYVGATRARKKLFLSCAMMRHRFGAVDSLPSRFIRETPQELIEKIDFRRQGMYSLPSATQARPAHRSSPTPKPQPAGVHYVYEENETFQAGRLVHHPTFGRGRIVTTEGVGDSLKLEISFTGIGTKKIMARFAKLKVVG
jgi:DNA helicase II / ATP-dependent DNA helicase PcrA